MEWSQCNYFRACLKVNSLICALCFTHLQKTWLANTSCGWPWSSPPSSARWATWRGSWARCCRRWRSPGNPSRGSRWCRGQTWYSRSISESGQDGWTATKDNILLKRKGASALKIRHENLNNNEHQVPQKLFHVLPKKCKETPLLTSFLEFFSCRDLSCLCWSLLTSIQPRSMSDTVWSGREQTFIFTHINSKPSRFPPFPLTDIHLSFIPNEISYLGVQQTQADSVVHDVAIVRRVPVAAKTKT